MVWSKPRSSIEGYRIRVTSDTEEPTKEFTLPASATKTSIPDLSPDVDYAVTISAYAGSEESLPVHGQLTLESSSDTRGASRKPDPSHSVKCSSSAVADVVFLVDGSWSVGRANFKYVRGFLSAAAGAFQVGADRTRVGVVQYGSDPRTEFPLNRHATRPELLRAIGSLPYKGGDTKTGDALDYVLKNSFTEEGGARKDFPKVLVIITDGKSEDAVETSARQLRSAGVEIFVLGVQQADTEEMKLMASAPHRSHVFTVANFDQIRSVQKQLVAQLCAGVDEQLSAVVSGEEVVEPASNLQVLEVASKSLRLTWDAPMAEYSGYVVKTVPMMAGAKRQELYVGPGQSSVVVRDLSPDTEYQISVSALRGLVASEPLGVMQKTQPVKVLMECSLGVDVQADVVLLVDGSYSIGLMNFAKVRAFLEVLVTTFDIGRDKVQISLVQYSRDPHTEFYLNTHHDLAAMVKAVRSFPYRGGSTNTGRAMTYVREKVFQTARGARPNVPRVNILITDGKSSDAFQEPATKLRRADVEIFAVGVKDAVRTELEAIANEPADTHVYTVEDFDAFQRISKELTQSICLRIEQELGAIQQRGLIQPRALTFSEVGPRSFRAAWQIDAPNVESFLVQFKPAGGEDGQLVSMSVPGNELATVLPNLVPVTRYEVHVHAQYDKGRSLPITGFETTLEELGSVSSLRVSEETAESFRVSWQAAPGDVARYRLTYQSVGGEGFRLETNTAGPETTIVLQELRPQTTYRVTVTAEYGSGPGGVLQTEGTTKEVRGSPRDLRVFDETVSSMKASWEPAPGSVLQYRVAYRPSVGSPRKEVSVKGDTKVALLKNLEPGTQYDVAVTAQYSSGPGGALEGRGSTLEEVGPPKDLVTSDVTDTSFAVSWTAAPGAVKAYNVRWRSPFSGEAGDKMLPGDVTDTLLDGLSPETLYHVSVIAAYERGGSEPLAGQETTDASAAGKKLTVKDETERSMRVSWTPAPGKLLHYRLKYFPIGGGKETILKIPRTSTSTLMGRLQPTTTYNISVHPIYKGREGKARQGVGTTLSPYKAPRNLQTSEPTKTSFRVSWDPAPGEVRGYKVTFHPDGNDIDLGELRVGPYDNTVVLEELRAGTKYSVAVSGMFDGGESRPLAGEEKTTFIETTEPPPVDPSEAQCRTTARADLVLLVDGSWSIGRINFKTIRSFIARMVSVFDVGPDRVQIGLAQYSGDPKTEWHLNAHLTKTSLLEAIANLPYKGGNTMTGMAMNFILQNNFQTNVGMRDDARKIGILITDGKSQDEIVSTSQKLRDSGIELYAIGVKNADENELRSIATDPDEIHMYNVKDFKFLVDIVDELTVNLCNSVKGPGGEPEAPTDLVTSEVTHRSFRATWTAPGGPVDMYRLTYATVAGGPTEQLMVQGSLNSALLEGLSPLTAYQVNVYAVVGQESSEPLTGIETTLPLSAVSDMKVFDETSSSMKVSWARADGATGYMLLYKSTNATGPQLENEIRVGDVTEVQLVQLIPDTQYSISLYALHGEAASDPLERRGVTLPVLPAGVLRITDVTHSTMRLYWDAAPGAVRKYIITYKPEEGDLKEMEVDGDVTTLDLSSLISQTEYDVAVTPFYDEGPAAPMMGTAITDVVPAPKDLQFSEVTQTSFRVSWQHGAPDVSLYRIGWTKKGEQEPQFAILNSDETTTVLPNLDPDTEYSVTVTAIYPDESESEDLIGRERTLLVQPPRNLRIFNATTTTLAVKWDSAPGAVQNYKISYKPVAGGEPLSTQVGGKKTSVILQKLEPDTKYFVSVAAVYPTGVQREISGEGQTKPLGGVKNLQVTDPTTSSLRVRWEPAEGNVRQYRLFYVPSAGGAEDMEQVSGGTTNTVLRNLLSDTPYTVTVVPVYPEGEGLRQSDDGKTLPRTPPRNIQVYNPSASSLNVRWEPATGQVQQYRVAYSSLRGVRPTESVMVPGNVNNAFLDNLIPDTPYSVSVTALYADGEGSPVKDNGKTLPRAGPRNMRVFDPTTSTLTVGWDHAEGPVRQYRIAYAPLTGDPITEFTLVPGNRNNAMLQNLLPDTPYNITVEALYGEGPGGSLNGNGRTVGMLSPRNLRVSDEWYTRFRVAWDPVAAPVQGYRLTYTPAGTNQPVDFFVGDVTSYTLHNLQPGTTYDLKVAAQYVGGTSGPLTGQGTTLYLNVTHIETHNIDHDRFCIKWTPHRAATSYRIKLLPLDPSSKGQHEITIPAGLPQYCFDGLSPDALYTASIFVQTPNLEGPGVSAKERTLVKPTPVPTLPPTPSPPPTVPPAWSICRGAKADVVFLIDGSWSIGEESFTKVRSFVSGMIAAFDVIGPSGMQVSFVQYSDDAKTEFRLNAYQDKGVAMAAPHHIRYRGGNTKTGVALKHTYEKAFSVENGMRRNVPKVLVTITDGRSQDEVKTKAAKLQHAGYSVFAIGVADVDFVELQEIGSKPSERHVFVVDDFDAFDTIKENLITFICETASSSCPLIFLNGFTSPGFRMLEAFNLTEKTYGSVRGVSMEPGSFNSFAAYRLHKDAFLSQPTTEIHPDGLPPSFTLILMIRLLPDSPSEAFDIWQVSSKDHKPETGVTLDPSSQTLSFYNKDVRGEIQRVTFDNDRVKRIFHGSFHKLHILVSSTGVKLNIDCQEVAEKELKEAGNTSSDGYQVLGKMSRSIGSRGESATFQLQMFDIVCSLGWTSRDRCCDLPSMRDELKCPSLPNSCSCTSAGTGPPGPQGPVGGPGSKGPRGERGESGPVVSTSWNTTEEDSERSRFSVSLLCFQGPPGKEGSAGPRGPSGPMGPPGSPGAPGGGGKPGNPGDTGTPVSGDFAPQNMMRSIARQVCEQLVSAQMSRVDTLLNQIPNAIHRSNNPGPPGPPGATGNQGPRGEPGATGRSGFPGNSGPPGQPGERGIAGEKGERGSSIVGQKGPRGAAGTSPGPPGESRTGPTGPSGAAGPRGPPGRPGYAGVRGPPGPPGYCDSSQCVGIPYNGQGYAGTYQTLVFCLPSGWNEDVGWVSLA
uniref:Collagen alpha-1(XII) chain n=1 Tax=Gasterosteus aculeatus aculeatus TaxID=481459 RepID=G3PDH7_GASAC